MPIIVKNINSEIINWAIMRAGYELDKFYMNNPKIEEWINNVRKPTIKQLEDFTNKVHVPFGYMFLNEPPKEELSIPFFRTGNTIVNKV